MFDKYIEWYVCSFYNVYIDSNIYGIILIWYIESFMSTDAMSISIMI